MAAEYCEERNNSEWFLKDWLFSFSGFANAPVMAGGAIDVNEKFTAYSADLKGSWLSSAASVSVPSSIQ